MSIKISTYNCNSIRRPIATEVLTKLCNENDIIAVQEHMLPQQDLCHLSRLHPDFIGKGTHTCDLADGPIRGRPSGGVAFLWRKSIDNNVKILKIDDPRFICATITSENVNMMLINVYLPYECNDNVDEYLDSIGVLTSLVDNAPTHHVCVVGDFNADIHKRRFGQHVAQLCTDKNLVFVDIERLPDSSFTYMSAAHNSTSWLDHVLCSHSTNILIDDVKIMYDYVLFDHIPMQITLNMRCARMQNVQYADREGTCAPNWVKASDRDRRQYSHRCELLARSMHVPREVIVCKDAKCTAHESQIMSIYNDICKIMERAAAETLPQRTPQIKNNETNVLPGWNDYVNEYHEDAKFWHYMWRCNRQRHGYVYEMMKTSRTRFRLALRQCKAQEQTLRDDKMAESLQCANDKEFWQAVKKRTNAKMPLPLSVNGVHGEQNICELFAANTREIMNQGSTINTEREVSSVNIALNNIEYTDHMLVSAVEVQNAVKLLKSGRAAGTDRISAEHIKHSGPRMLIIIALFLSVLLVHGTMPNKLLQTILVPIVKDKNGDISDISNYRLIAVSNSITKIIELILLNRYEECFSTCDNQFGFRAGHGTEQCV